MVDKVVTTHKQEDEDEAAGAKEDVDATTQRMDAHRLKGIPQDMEGSIPEGAGAQIQSTR